MLQIQSQDISVTLAWIPSHVGTTNNGLIDKAAKSYSSKIIDIPVDVSGPFVDSRIDNLALAAWQDRWD